MDHIESVALDCIRFGESLRSNPYRLLLGDSRTELCRMIADDNTPPIVVPVPIGRKSGPAAFEGAQYTLHRMRLVFPVGIAGGRPRRIPAPHDSAAVLQTLEQTAGKRRSLCLEARLGELAELVQRLGRFGLSDLARERGAPNLGTYSKDLWAQMDAFMPHAVLIDDDRFWLAVCNEVRAGNMARLAGFFTPPPPAGRPVSKIVNECIIGLIGLASRALARNKEPVTLARASGLVQQWQLRVELQPARRALRKRICPRGELPSGVELAAVANALRDKFPQLTRAKLKNSLRELLAGGRVRVPNAARLLLLGLPLWSQGGLHRHILSAAGLGKECEGVVEYLAGAGEADGT